MRIEFTQSLNLFFKSGRREKLTQTEKARFIKENELKLTHVEVFSFFIFKSALHELMKL